MQRRDFDAAIIGGGLMGCAIARDAAGRGLSVILCEQDDLANGASSSTLKLVHGGLGHLITGNLGALRRALGERRLLHRAAPHCVREMRFVLPYHTRMWPLWAIGSGLALYDRLGGRQLAPRRLHTCLDGPIDPHLQPHFEAAASFSDCVADDSRLAILNALDARGHGAEIRPRLRCVVAEREGAQWRLSLESADARTRFSLRAKVLVNATGAQTADTADHVIHTTQKIAMRYYRDKMLVVRLPDFGSQGYVLPAADGRLVYVVPQADDHVLVGVQGEVSGVAADRYTVGPRDVAELCDVVGQYFRRPIHPEDVVRTDSGAWALPAAVDAQAVDHAVVVDAPPRLAMLLTVFGGSLTTHRYAAENAVDMVGRVAKSGPAWTKKKVLPGGGFPLGGIDQLARALSTSYPFLGSIHAERLVKRYGTRAANLMAGAREAADFGAWFGNYLTERELSFLHAEEWAHSAQDVVWRRTLLGDAFDPARLPRVEAAMAALEMPLAETNAA
ncbi:MAG: glycerol-3-phosphate dehydrogenase [Alphaproteobacteria bacterium]